MREIKFRGRKSQRLDQGEWIYGYYWQYLRDFIKDDGADYLIDPETLGQYTGLKDKNSVEIYEGDIIESNYGVKKIVRWTSTASHNGFNISMKGAKNHSVIGNIYENPDLLRADKGSI